MKAIELANDLQTLVDGLRKNPDADVPHGYLYFSSFSTDKEQFKNLARILPRPLKKGLDYEGTSHEEIVLKYDGAGISISAATKRSTSCTLISPAIPAVYKCDPILSIEEESKLESMVTP